MKRKLVLSGSALLSLLCVAGVQAEEGVSGHVEVTGKSIDVNGNKAKFSEYGDADSGITGGVEMKYDAESGFLNFNADEIARDTQNFKIEAGQYEKFKLDAYYKEIQHNFDFDARSFYTGVGTNNLTTTATSASLPTNAAAWPSVFDYAISRDQYGAGIKLNMLKPFFADFSVSQEDRTGIKAAGVYSSVSIELPEPVDYETNTFKAEIGYGEDPFFVSMSYLNSSFDNANDYLYFQSLTAANTSEFLTLPPDNDYSKLAFKGRVKLPLSSSLSLSYGKSEAESESNLATTYNTAGNARTNTLSDPLFNGKVETTSYNIVLASNPLNFLDGKVFYSNYDKENKSDRISSTVGATTFTNHLFDYEKKSYGVEAGLKLPADVKLTPYYKFVNVDRHRGDLPETDDDIYGIDAKWSGLDFLAVTAGYERMERDSPWHQLEAVISTDQASANAIEPYVRRFDAADQDRDTFKLGLDISPNDRLNIGLGYKHKTSDYTETVYGLLEEESDSFNISADFAVNNAIMISGYADYEVATIDQTERAMATTVNTTTANPVDTNATDGNYTWTANQKNKSLDYGVAVDMAVIPKVLSLRAQFDHVRSDGLADFTYYESVPTGYTNETVDSQNWDDYSKNSILLKATYNTTEKITLVGGYAYEHYKYNDQFSDGYTYVWGATTKSYLTGAGMDPNYNANVVFLTAKYKF
ncbi:MAG: MtrB/PioB family decaheme-associated outer membrane protein [Desulfobulbia bacterium]